MVLAAGHCEGMDSLTMGPMPASQLQISMKMEIWILLQVPEVTQGLRSGMEMAGAHGHQPLIYPSQEDTSAWTMVISIMMVKWISLL